MLQSNDGNPLLIFLMNQTTFYLGISGWGRMNSHSGPFVQWEEYNEDIVRIYNMLSGHAIMYISDRYIDLAKRIAYHAGYNIEDHVDLDLRKFNVGIMCMLLMIHIFQTSSCNQTVTYSPLSEQKSVECITYMKPYYLPQSYLMYIAHCPLRISLFGGSTDSPYFVEKYGYGSVISFASNLKTYVTVGRIYLVLII